MIDYFTAPGMSCGCDPTGLLCGQHAPPDDCLACPSDCRTCSLDETNCECYEHQNCHPEANTEGAR